MVGDMMLRIWRDPVAIALALALALSMAANAQTPPAAPSAAASPGAASPAKEEVPRYLVYFDEFSAYLSPRAKAVIAKAVKEAKAAGVKSITVQARASATGTVQTNKYLAMTRASIVADELEADGIEPGLVQQQPIGQTGSHDPSVFNRRVDIILHR
jgi:outer membrane protein OmpA-like peptidoglycan-associated protein